MSGDGGTLESLQDVNQNLLDKLEGGHASLELNRARSVHKQQDLLPTVNRTHPFFMLD
jgi:hypothetical protein